MSNLMKIHPVGVELLHATKRTDGWTDWQTYRHDKANSHFSQFCECTQELFF